MADEEGVFVDEPPGFSFREAGPPPPPPAQPLRQTDGKYVDEFLNLTLRLFGGNVIG